MPTFNDLLMPYGAYLQMADHETVAVALVVAAARQARTDSPGQVGHLPLEQDTPIGNFLAACRTGDKAVLRKHAGSCPDIDLRATYGALLNAHSVPAPVDVPMESTDELIAHARAALDCQT